MNWIQIKHKNHNFINLAPHKRLVARMTNKSMTNWTLEMVPKLSIPKHKLVNNRDTELKAI